MSFTVRFNKTACAARIRNAAEVEYLDENGGVSALSGGNIAQATLGKFSYSKGTSGTFNVSGVPAAPMSVSLLEKAGLLKRGLAP